MFSVKNVQKLQMSIRTGIMIEWVYVCAHQLGVGQAIAGMYITMCVCLKLVCSCIAKLTHRHKHIHVYVCTHTYMHT